MCANLCRAVHAIFLLFDEVPDHALRCALVRSYVFRVCVENYNFLLLIFFYYV